MQERAGEEGISEDGVSDNSFASAFLFNTLQITSLLQLCDATMQFEDNGISIFS
jgi:hypothetical protein